jgi:hypothetical protein
MNDANIYRPIHFFLRRLWFFTGVSVFSRNVQNGVVRSDSEREGELGGVRGCSEGKGELGAAVGGRGFIITMKQVIIAKTHSTL